MEYTQVYFKAGVVRDGRCAIWAVDSKGRQLHTEPICTVFAEWHGWFPKWLESIGDCPYKMVALPDDEEGPDKTIEPPITETFGGVEVVGEPRQGTTIDQACTEAVEIARRLDCVVRVAFNDVHLRVSPNQTAAELVRIYFELRRAGTKTKGGGER